MSRRVRLARRDGAAPVATSVAHYGGSPRWCLASATVGNPGELATRLTGLDAVVEVTRTTRSPRGEKLFALWNPPIVDEDTGRAAARSARRRG